MDKRALVVPGEPVRVTGNGRRYFSKAHREAVVAKCLAPGASLAAVALANGFNANLVRKWVRQRGVREARANSSARLIPVSLAAEPVASLHQRPTARAVDCASMQIQIGRARLVINGVVDRGQLLVVLDALLRAR
jgi:transposase